MKNILIVDDDIAFLKTIAKNFETVKDKFNTIFVKDGVSAGAQLKKKEIDLVISDLHMPKLDGFALLEYITGGYPDIPVIIITAFGRPKLKSILGEKGVSAYFEKPFDINLLMSEINRLMEKRVDGGILKSASLEMFTQLVEMEQKTCTIRVQREGGLKGGVLFFRDGELYSARIGNLKGIDAAYRIFSWSNVTLNIENDCKVLNKKIDSDLQAMLLEAMRLKDENGDSAEDFDNPSEVTTSEKGLSAKKDSPVEKLKKIIAKKSSDIIGIEEIYTEPSWNDFLERVSKIGSFFEAGSLKACYVHSRDLKNMIIAPDKESVVISVNSKCDREKIYRILMD